MLRLGVSLLFIMPLLVSTQVDAFTFSDGTKMQCIAQGRVVTEFYAPPEHEVAKLGRIGMTVTNDENFMIIWNTAELNKLPPAVHDLLAEGRVEIEVVAYAVKQPDGTLLSDRVNVGKDGYAQPA